MYKQEEKVQGKGQSSSKAATTFDCALGWKLYSITVRVERSYWKSSPHQYQKGAGLSGSSYMPNIWSLSGFLSDIVEEGEILDMLYCTEIGTFCLTWFWGFQAVPDDTGGIEIGILEGSLGFGKKKKDSLSARKLQAFCFFDVGCFFLHMNTLCIEAGLGLPDCGPV